MSHNVSINVIRLLCYTEMKLFCCVSFNVFVAYTGSIYTNSSCVEISIYAQPLTVSEKMSEGTALTVIDSLTHCGCAAQHCQFKGDVEQPRSNVTCRDVVLNESLGAERGVEELVNVFGVELKT